jgi:hypothetical protein
MADLITLDDYKILEGINSTQYDEKFETLITAVSALVRNYTGQEFDTYNTSPGITETFNLRWESDTVELSFGPVLQIQNVYERSAQSEAYTEIFSDGAGSPAGYDYVLETPCFLIRTTDSGYKNWPKGIGAVKVTYTAGYATVPKDLELAVADIVTYYHNNEQKQRQSIASATREGAPASAIRNDPGFPDHIRRVLDLYRNI